MYFNNQGIIYKNHLQEISGIKFTNREIDVMSCVLHGRNEKKISSLLEISQKTVATHNRNIMSKLGCNSKEYIIDFLEKSNKLQYVNQHYFDLIIESSFKKQLARIGKEINRQHLFCYVELKNATDEEKQRLEHFKEVFQVANVIIIENKNNASDISCNLYSINEQSQNKWKNLNVQGQSDNNIFLLFDKDINTEELGQLEYINFAAAENYYFAVFDLLKKIINKPELEKFIEEFKREYNSLKHYSTDHTNSAATNDKVLADDKEPADITIDVKLPTKHTVRKLSYPIIFTINFIIAIGSTITIWNFFLKSDSTINNENVSKSDNATQTINDLELFLESLKSEPFTANNVDLNKANNNQNLIKKVEKILDYQNIKDVQKYFDQPNVDAAVLISYLYNLQALSSYYMYNEHDGTKAQKMLLYAKHLAENYVNSRSKVIVNFDKLTPSEVFTELYIIKGLPQIYTRLIYSLGRTYIYNNASLEGRKYFE